MNCVTFSLPQRLSFSLSKRNFSPPRKGYIVCLVNCGTVFIVDMSLIGEAVSIPVLDLHNPGANPATFIYIFLLLLKPFILKHTRCAHTVWSPGRATIQQRGVTE